VVTRAPRHGVAVALLLCALAQGCFRWTTVRAEDLVSGEVRPGDDTLRIGREGRRSSVRLLGVRGPRIDVEHLESGRVFRLDPSEAGPIERREFNTGGTALVVLGCLAGAAAVVFAAFVAAFSGIH
jgi:hypothetical protein